MVKYNYGLPLYCAAWVPPAAEVESENVPHSHRHVVLAGGGGERVLKSILLSAFDFESNSLSDQPVARLETGSDVANKCAVHPGGQGLVCSFPNFCRWYQWDRTDEHKLSLVLSDKTLDQLEDVGQQQALTFNNEGTLLATGGEDGKLRVFKWPGMENTLNEDEANVHDSVKDLDFSPDGKFLVSVGSDLASILNVATSASLASLPKQNGEIFVCARFSRSSDTDHPVLYVAANRDKRGSIIKWNTSTWERISSTNVSRDPVCAFNVSPDGKLISVGTIAGDILIISCANMRVQSVVKRAHLLPASALAFSSDSRALLSASMDSGASVTMIKDIKKKKRDGMCLWTIKLFILLAIAIHYARTKDFLPLKMLWSCNVP